MPSPLVSVLIPAYNAEKFLSAAIESVLVQSFQNWELVICDDASKDSTLHIARRYEEPGKVRVVGNKGNLGQFQTHNRLAEMASGKYIKYLHADDLLFPHCLDMMVHFMEYFADAAVGLSAPRSDWEIPPVRLEPCEAMKRHFFGFSPVSSNVPTSVIIRRDAFWKHGPFGTTLISEDTLLFAKLCLREPCVLMPSGLFWYRPGGQFTTRIRRERTDVWEPVNYMLQLLTDPACPLSADEKGKARRNIYSGFWRNVARIILRGQFAFALSIIRKVHAPWRSIFAMVHAPVMYHRKVQESVMTPRLPSWESYAFRRGSGSQR